MSFGSHIKPPAATALVALTLLVPSMAPAAAINVFAAASLTDALKEIAAAYEKQSNDKVAFNFGASSTLARQIQEGAPADIFFSADEAKMDALEKQGRIVPGTRKSRLSNSLVVVVSAGHPPPIYSASDLTNAAVKRIALADPKVVPAGIYARQYLEKLNLWSKLESKAVPAENVRAALAAVASGNVEAGVIYRTDVRASRKVKVAVQVPPTDTPKISYPLALVTGAPQAEAAKRFLAYLCGKASGAVFVHHGFVVLSSAAE